MSSKFAYIFCKLVLNASMYLIQCKWTTYEVVCTSSWMVLKVFSMAVHILGKMAVVCACSGVGIKVRPVSFNVLLCVLICLGKDIGGYCWSKQLLHWLFACLGPGACHALQPIHFSPHFHIQLSPYILPLPLIQWPLPLLSMWAHPLHLSTSHPSPSKEDPSPSSPFPDCGASTSISAPSNAPPSTTPSHSSSNFYCMHIKYHFWVVHGDRLYQSRIRHRCSRYQGCP